MTDLHECTGPERDAEEVAKLWSFAQQRGMDRERFLEALSDGGLTAALAACMDLAGPAEQRADQEVTDDMKSTARPNTGFKDTSSFVEHDDGRCLEARLDHMHGCNYAHQPVLCAQQLRQPGRGAGQVAAFDRGRRGQQASVALHTPTSRPCPAARWSRTWTAAGNQRAMFDLVNGESTEGTQWRTGRREQWRMGRHAAARRADNGRGQRRRAVRDAGWPGHRVAGEGVSQRDSG